MTKKQQSDKRYLEISQEVTNDDQKQGEGGLYLRMCTQ